MSTTQQVVLADRSQYKAKKQHLKRFIFLKIWFRIVKAFDLLFILLALTMSSSQPDSPKKISIPETKSQRVSDRECDSVCHGTQDDMGASQIFSTKAGVKAFIINNFLPLGFSFVLIVALIFPRPGEEVKSWKVEGYGVVDSINVFIVFFISGLGLKTEDILAALTAYKGLGYGLVSILAITPCLGFLLIELPISPDEFAIGLTIFAAVPTTISSGVTLVNQAYGNGTLALLLTVASNLLGILTVPFALGLILSTGSDVKIDAVDLLVKLAITILLPLVIGKVIREASKGVQAFVKKHKVALSLISNCNLFCIVWQNMSNSRDKLLDQSPLDVFTVAMLGIGMHLAFLLFNWAAVKILGLEEKEMKAVLLMTSQKPLPVAVTVISFLKEDEVGNLGLITVPCILGQLAQLFIDSFIVSRWATNYRKRNPELP